MLVYQQGGIDAELVSLLLAAAPGRRVEVLFASVGLELHGEPSHRCWDNLFAVKPPERLPVPQDLAVVRQLLEKARQVFAESDRLHNSPLANKSSDERLTRLSLLYVTSFPGSGKSHLRRSLGVTVDLLRAGDVGTERRLLGTLERVQDSDGNGPDASPPADAPSSTLRSDKAPPLKDTILTWAQQLVLLGVNFNSERWSLSEEFSNGVLACLPRGRMIPLHLRILFFALADLSDADAAEAVWNMLVRRCSAAVTAGLLSPTDIRYAVEVFLKRRCGGSAPFAPLLIVVDELDKSRDFCCETYRGGRTKDAAGVFRSEC